MKWNQLFLVSLVAAGCGETNEDFLDVKLGNGFGCVLEQGQGVYCWGANDSGQLGQTPPKLGLESGVRHSDVPVFVEGTQDAISLSLGYQHACILTPNDVLCWGADGSGQIGTGIADACEGSATHIGFYDVPCQPTVTSLGLGRQEWVSAGPDATCVGNGTTTTCRGSSRHRLSSLSNLTSITMSSDVICGLNSSGKVKCDKRPAPDDYGVVESIGPITSFVLGGGTNICVIVESGAVQCWGDRNSSGELGAGHVNQVHPWESTTPMASAVQIVSGGGGFCTLSDSGEVHCWGSNATGQTGVAPTFVEHNVEMTDPESYQPPPGPCPYGGCEATPVQIEGIGVATRLAAGAGTSCVVTENQEVKCWGALVETHVPTVIEGPWSQ